ncbi:MAG: hypothetical protein GF329_12180 [Candidatus Lokiarchaeota archaeon]|nr:hypothetical protein [Candidatus Lokiarchaeota archaeon]
MGKNKYGKGTKTKNTNLSGGAPVKGGKVRASHILVDTQSEAENIYKDLNKGSNFSSHAIKYSKCSSRETGGDLGLFTKDDMVPEFWKAVTSLKINEISQPVKTEFGYHIIKRTK